MKVNYKEVISSMFKIKTIRNKTSFLQMISFYKKITLVEQTNNDVLNKI